MGRRAASVSRSARYADHRHILPLDTAPMRTPHGATGRASPADPVDGVLGAVIPELYRARIIIDDIGFSRAFLREDPRRLSARASIQLPNLR